MLKPLVPMSKVMSLAGLRFDTSITFCKTEDLVRFVEIAQNEGKLTVEQIHEFYCNFMFGLDGERGCLNISTFTINHDETGSCNLVLTHVTNEGKDCLVLSTADKGIAKGAEF